MKTLIVREAFALGAEFYARGAEITDPAIIKQAKAEFPTHVLDSQFDAEVPKAAVRESDSKPAAPAVEESPFKKPAK